MNVHASRLEQPECQCVAHAKSRPYARSSPRSRQRVAARASWSRQRGNVKTRATIDAKALTTRGPTAALYSSAQRMEDHSATGIELVAPTGRWKLRDRSIEAHRESALMRIKMSAR